MLTSSAKAKGRNLQKLVVTKLLEVYDELTILDIRSCPMGSNGEDVVMSQKAKDLISYSIECKSKAKGFTPVYDALAQAKSQDAGTPLAVIKQDRRKPLVVVDLDHFMQILKDIK